MIDLLRTWWERLSLYLPVILMGVLALGTYWLARSTPLLMAPPQGVVVGHDPDYFMRKFSVKSYDAAGRLTNEVVGDDARHFPDTDTLEITSVFVRSFNEVGRLTTATAKLAVTNSDASEVQLFGAARIVVQPPPDSLGASQPRMEFRGEFLHAFLETERVTSHKPVDLIRGNDRFKADTLDYNNLDRVLQLKGRVKGMLVPNAQ